MLHELSIRNMAVIEEANIHFHQGFHVLTGETGAGKSILIDALSLVVGGRGSADMVRYGCDKAEVEALFDLSGDHPVWQRLQSLGIQHDSSEMLIVRRELTATGKSSSRVNGQLVTITMLREIGESLVNIHGQHEHQSLLKSEQHLEWLDMYGGAELLDIKRQYNEQYEQLLLVRSQLHELENSSRHNMQMQDLYHFQIEEISAAKLKPGEDEELLEQRKMLMYAEKRSASVNEAYGLLNDGQGLDAISRAISRLTDIVSYDESALAPMLEQLQTAYYAAEDVMYQLRGYRDGIESDPEQLQYVEDRLDLIRGLKRKYGESIEEINAYLAKITEERDKLENRDELLAELKEREADIYAAAYELAQQLSSRRREVAERLAKEIKVHLMELQMGAANFEVDLVSMPHGESSPVRLSATGIDQAVFMMSTNPGEPLKPLHKVASGGEMSRIMLALKTIFAAIDQIPVLVFDEVDTGVSGRAAQAIAEKLSKLAKGCQVFSITHLPQVACMADHHYEIRKQFVAERTYTSVTELYGEQRINELARMLGGVEITEKTKHHAQEMLDLAIGLKGA
ncbi:DNA repair protein RecN [Paenibacillus montaniterrae]|uniref:DNA repair protein RecN n=1 Tax=Paenibacillus montaniterrae TaxID=429341 RepID=A0A920CWH7_9BACL|nr:DNA repair protein RecN [Paenibacillus montaniterrae]GIP15245.1 DNA repair protein RecN [Paenibacillus montaniterrae]